MGQYISDIRSSRETFELSKVIGYARDISTSTFGTGSGINSVWNGVADVLMHLAQEANGLLPVVMEVESAVTSMCC